MKYLLYNRFNIFSIQTTHQVEEYIVGRTVSYRRVYTLSEDVHIAVSTNEHKSPTLLQTNSCTKIIIYGRFVHNCWITSRSFKSQGYHISRVIQVKVI